ncbi:MAG: carbohydrate kinase family protein [Patescibacteria group bacterium]|nr:carbohydrate kinase family protein [Patescibacteria group bacterium]
MPAIVTIGSAVRDITFLTDKGRVIKTPENLTAQSLLAFEYGAKIKSDEVYLNFGGGACNTATTFVELGIETSVNCKVGNDSEGEAVIKNLEKIGIKTDLVQISENKKTGFALVVINKNEGEGERVIFVHKGASGDLEIRKDDLNKSEWIYLTALAGKWEEGLNEINKIIEENKIKLAWNPGATQISAGKNKIAELLRNTEILIINKDEAIELVQSDKNVKLDYNEINDAVILCRIIKSWGPKTVIITDGINGAYLFDGGKNVLFSSATSKDRVDTTGAGDSFGSALVGGYMLTGDLETALKYGIINAGNVVSERGAQNGILNKKEIEEKLGRVKVSYL